MLSNTDKPTGKNEVLAGPAPQARQSLDSGTSGTKSSNTVPPTSINQTTTKILRTGIDSLYLSYRGQMHEETSAKLSKLKSLAQSDIESRSALAQFKVGDQLLEVLGHGRPPYTYVLIDGWFRLEVAKPKAMLLPMAYCKIASSLLTAAGHDASVDALNKVIASIGVSEGQPNVSRIDLCADFITDYPLDQLTEAELVTKARSFSRHTVAREFSGFSFSAGAPTSARLYNKSLEMRSKNYPRPELESLWRKNGWDGKQDVWRLEFQLRRQTLAAFELVPYEKVIDALPDLWKYATETWLRHTVPSSTDTTQSRWPTSEVWLALQSAQWAFEDGEPLTRIYPDKGRAPSDEYLFVSGLSALTSFAAREDIASPREAVLAYFNAAQSFHNNRSNQSIASGRLKYLDVDFEEYFLRKMESKRKSYNTGLNSPVDGDVHPADKAVTTDLQVRAQAYRDAKDGE